MKKIINKFILLIAVLSVYTGPVQASGGSIDAKPPEVEAHSAILMDFETGRVLWEKNAYEPKAMASTTKIMTAVIALENGNMSDTVTVSRRAAAAPKVNMSLKQGEKISMQALMYALMLQSSNDAAIAIAEHVGGSVENFCNMMTQKAKELGAKDTLFVTPNGLDEGDHHSTAYDMALITRYALNNPDFVKLINTREATAQSDRTSYYISNKNRLLNEFPGANGVKTGFTGKAGQCFVGSAERNGLRLISVVFASGWGAKGREQKWIDTKRVLTYGFGAFEYNDILDEGSVAGEIWVERSKTPKIKGYYSEGLMLPLTDEEKESLRIEISMPEEIKAPVTKGDVIGTAKIIIKDEVYKEIDIKASDSAERHDLKTSLEKVLEAFFDMASVEKIKLTLPEIFGE